MHEQDLSRMRQEYDKYSLEESEVDPDPFRQFSKWFEQARQREVVEANAMSLATVKDGQPSVRIVLLKGFDHRGFVFYTNYNSYKGQALAQNPKAALNFYWPLWQRQVRIEGEAHKISEEESNAYFQTRDKGSRLGAWASPQSQPIAGREELEKRLKKIQQQFGDQDIVPCPPHWGGYRLAPHSIEFWQGRKNRLHDRIQFRLQQGKWIMQRLAP
ncbi:MAG: pyridoxamine 5'-phosphate oxidase [Bacteroidetes bacterium]|nr:MAG: pyridoxamine 5'-phosphate oxidase [Bacteroidota bacterium]